MTPEVIATILVLCAGAVAIIIELYVLSDLKQLVREVREALDLAHKCGDSFASHRMTLEFKHDREQELARKAEAVKQALEKADKHREEIILKANELEYQKDKEVESLKGQIARLQGEVGTLRDELFNARLNKMSKVLRKKKGPIAE